MNLKTEKPKKEYPALEKRRRNSEKNAIDLYPLVPILLSQLLDQYNKTLRPHLNVMKFLLHI